MMLSFDPFDSIMKKEKDATGDIYVYNAYKETRKQND